jgi:hypothetical protein
MKRKRRKKECEVKKREIEKERGWKAGRMKESVTIKLAITLCN